MIGADKNMQFKQKKCGLKNRLNQVDMQASMITTVIVGLSFIAVYCFNYFLTYNDMIFALRERSDSIYSYVERVLVKDTFYDINTKEDMDKESYNIMKTALHNTKLATNVMYLYTVKKNADGNFIYVVDGLAEDSGDFRYPGDLIEPETVPELERAFQDEIVYPDKIKKAPWGYIFVSYYPIHDNGRVVGVIGIEFEAKHQYTTFHIVSIGTPLIGITFAVIAALISIWLFRRISNPNYKDFANTDYLTNLKNRNAFELDMANLKTKPGEWKNLGIFVADLNGLKKINDTYGHQAGDDYISHCGNVLTSCLPQCNRIYRVGGDEFIAMLNEATFEKMKQLESAMMEEAASQVILKNQPLSIAIGFAIYDEAIDGNISDAYRRADQNMYNQKKLMKKQGNLQENTVPTGSH